MLRSLALAALLLLTLLWKVTAWADPGSSSASFHIRGKTPVKTNLGITTRLAVTGGTVITVTTDVDEVNDDGDCSLREAIQAASMDSATDACPAGDGGDTVTLPPATYVLTQGQLELTGTITLQGSITSTSILDGNFQNRVLYIQPAATVMLSHLDIRNGYMGPVAYCCAEFEGGGILNSGITLIAYSLIHNNEAGSREPPYGPPYGGNGGGIYNDINGILTVVNSTISGNKAGPGYFGYGRESLVCSPGGEGGGIYNVGTLTLDNTTITGNHPGKNEASECDGQYHGKVGGIDIWNNFQYGDYTAKTYIKNSIIADNEGDECRSVFGAIISLGYNLIQDTGNCIISGSFVWALARFGSLQDNGGPTLTHALRENSPAIDAGACTNSTGITVTMDQRGEPRPQGDGCDIGAYESPYTSTFTITDTNLPVIRR